MPVQIGDKSHSFTDPTGLLSDCHRRIEMFLHSLESVGNIIDKRPSEETSRTLESALRYFAEAAPKHTADEEESLFPRLRRIQNSEIASALKRLDDLEADHQQVAPLHARVEELGRRYLSTGELTSAEIAEFRNSVGRLISMYKQHLAAEDDFIFPLAARVLPESDKAAVANEMAGRRKVKLVTPLAAPNVRD